MTRAYLKIEAEGKRALSDVSAFIAAVDRFVIESAGIPSRLLTGDAPSGVSLLALSGSVYFRMKWEPLVTLAAIFGELETRRWMNRGASLAEWYRRRPGFRVADEVEPQRN